jgi:hypothetical protein
LDSSKDGKLKLKGFAGVRIGQLPEIPGGEY